MSLDDKLREIVNKLTVQLEGKYHKQVADIAIAQIKQAFESEGWVSPDNAKKVQEMVNQMANLANDAFHMPTKKG